ncbi:MAG: hypothetical protein ACRYG5_05690 [Janthinobacterium lividum]
MDQRLYRVRYDADNATWRIVAPPPEHAATIPVRRDAHGAWHVHTQIGLLGGVRSEKSSPIGEAPASIYVRRQRADSGSASTLKDPGEDMLSADSPVPRGLERLDIAMGEAATAEAAQVLTTSGLSDCSAITLLSQRDPHTGIYRHRSMLHVTGSSLDAALVVQRGGSRRMMSAGAAVEALIAEAGAVDSKLIVAFGTRSSSTIGRVIVIAQEYKGRVPLLSLIERVGAADTRFYIHGSRCEITPRGEYLEEDARTGGLSDTVASDLAMAREHV